MSSFFDYGNSAHGRSEGRHPQSVPVAESTFWSTGSHIDWQHLFAHTQTLRWRAGESVIAANAPNQSVFIITSGRVARAGAHDLAAAERQTSWTEGQVVGIGSFFGGHLPRHELVAASDVEAVRLTRDELDVIAAREPDLANRITTELARLMAGQVAR